jgi:undecaprenyl pyrophosphate phosphatase UppP
MSGKAGVLRVFAHHCVVNPDFTEQSCRTLCFSNQLQDRNHNFLLGCARWSIFQKQVQKLFISPAAAALFLILNGGLLCLAERLRRNATACEDLDGIDQRIATQMSCWQSAKIGIAQILALLPGFSRTGSTIAGGLLVGFSHEEALRFSFLLATPIIGAAALLKLPMLFRSGNVAAISKMLCSAQFVRQ